MFLSSSFLKFLLFSFFIFPVSLPLHALFTYVCWHNIFTFLCIIEAIVRFVLRHFLDNFFFHRIMEEIS